MRRNSWTRASIVPLLLVLGACSTAPPRHTSTVPDYSGRSCGELAKEAKRLARRIAGTQEFLLPQGRKDAQEQRNLDKAQLKAVKRAALDRACLTD